MKENDAIPFRFPGCDVERVMFEHIRVVGPIENSHEALATLTSCGFRVTRSGPYSDREMFPKVDDKRFLFLGERQIREYEAYEDCRVEGTPATSGLMDRGSRD